MAAAGSVTATGAYERLDGGGAEAGGWLVEKPPSMIHVALARYSKPDEGDDGPTMDVVSENYCARPNGSATIGRRADSGTVASGSGLCLLRSDHDLPVS